MTDRETDAIRSGIAVVGAVARELDQISRRVAPIIKRINQVVQEHEPVLRKIGQVVIHVALWHKCSELLKSAGWLPHRTMPYQDIDELSGDTEQITALILDHYRENWSDIREYIESELLDCEIDEESMATFVEALEAHEKGLYRSVCRVLLPEIERLVRVELESDNTGNLKVNKILVDFVDDNDMSLGDLLLGDIYNFELLERLVYHLYEHVNDTNRQGFVNDPVPNRHAAIHGLVIYSTEQNSLNTIFMADYIFRLVALAKNVSATEPDDDE